MASYATLSTDDRWALSHYVLTMGPPAEESTAAQFAGIQVDPTKESGTAEVAKSIPVDFAIKRMTENR